MNQPSSSVPSLAILGPDLVVAGAPATQAQLIAACLQLGFDAVVPASWGDELVAEAALRQLAIRRREPVVLCACPRTHAMLAADARFAPRALPLTAPAVAAARYVRALYAGIRVRVTYLGDCAGATHADLDDVRSAQRVMHELARAGIEPESLEATAAPGHRRHLSLPGGAPHADAVREASGHELVEISGEGGGERLAELVLSGRQVLVDIGPATGCGCCGGRARNGESARLVLAALEPPRAGGEVLSPTIRPEISLDVIPEFIAPAPRRTPAAPDPARPPSARPVAGDREVEVPTVPMAASGASGPSKKRRRFRTAEMMRAIAGFTAQPTEAVSRRTPATRQAPAVPLVPADAPPPRGELPVVPLDIVERADAAPRAAEKGLVVRLPDLSPYRVPPPQDTGMAGRVALGVAALAALTALFAAIA